MATKDRDECIDAYFAAVDDDDPALARSALSEDFVYESLSGTLEGFEGLADYIAERDSGPDSEHVIERRIHADEVSVIEGVVTGTGPDGESTETAFCDIFEFDDSEGEIRSISVYVNDS